MNFFCCLILFLCTSVLFGQISPTAGVVYVKVNGTGDGSSWAQSASIENAISNAPENSEIRINEGTYELDVPLVVNKKLKIRGGYRGNDHYGSAILSGRSRNQVMQIIKGGSGSMLRNLVIIDGYTEVKSGAGLYVENAENITFSWCEFRQNKDRSGKGGAAIYIYNAKNVIIDSTLFMHNTVELLSQGEEVGGGAITSVGSSDIKIDGNFYYNKSVQHGGAVYSDSDIVMVRSYFEGNEALQDGGAVYIRSGRAYIDRCGFVANKGFRGGALFCSDGLNKIIGSSFDSNKGEDEGSAIFTQAKLEMTNCNLVQHRNTALVYRPSTSSYLDVYNSIFYINRAMKDSYYGDITVPSGDYSTVDLQYNFLDENPNGTNNTIKVSPIFMNVLVQDMRLDVASPVIDAGSNALFEKVAGIQIQDAENSNGTRRLYGNAVEIGVYEQQRTQDIEKKPVCMEFSYPFYRQENVLSMPMLEWYAYTGAKGYKLSVGTTFDFEIIKELDVGDTRSYQIDTHLPEGKEILIRIDPYNDYGQAMYCFPGRFYVTLANQAPGCAKLTYPIVSSADIPLRPVIRWEHAEYASGYKLYVGESMDKFGILDGIDVGFQQEYSFTADLPEYTTIFVKIVPYNSVGEASSCTVNAFRTLLSPRPPACVSIVSPIAEDMSVSLRPLFRWDIHADAEGYKLYLGTRHDVWDIYNGQDLGDVSEYQIPMDLSENTKLFLKIVPYNRYGESASCDVVSFTTLKIPRLPTCTQVVSPENASKDIELTPKIQWEAADLADGYRIYIGTNADANDLIAGHDVEGNTSYVVSVPLKANTIYYVRIVPYNEFGSSQSCSTFMFRTTLLHIGGLRFLDQRLNYNGELQRITLEGTIPDGVRVAYSKNELREVGSTDAMAELTGNDYHPLSLSARLTIEPALLVVSVEDTVKVQDGQPFFGGKLSYTGFLGQDNIDSLTGSPLFSGTSQGAIRSGRYPIHVAGFYSPNYVINYREGQLLIKPQEFFWPNVITVNGDGYNDRLKIKEPNGIKKVGLTVFNMNGLEVYSNIDYDDTFNGEGLAKGLYFYLAKYLTEDSFFVKEYRGFLTIL